MLENFDISPLIIVIITTFISPLILKLFDYLLKRIEISDEKKIDLTNRISEINLLDSELFFCLQQSIWDIHRKNFENEFKTTVGRDLLRIKFEKSLEVFKLWVFEHEKKINSYTSVELHNEIFKLVKQIINSYENKWIDECIPKTVIDKFNEYHNGNIQWVFMTINSTMQNKYDTNIEKTYFIFKSLANGYNRAFFDAETVFKVMNGSLTGTSYKGKICP